MADTTYTDNVTVITADTMNDLNRLHYTILSDPADAAAVRTAIAAAGTAGYTSTGDIVLSGNSAIEEARANITQHATTMNFWTGPNILDGTGSAVTITACVNAPQAGANRKFYPLANTVLTHGATFDIDGNANVTAAAGDCWEIVAKTTSTYKVHLKQDAGFPFSLAGNGYQKLPSGLIIQWGLFAHSGGGGGELLTFPTAFTTLYRITGIENGSSPTLGFSAVLTSVSQATIYTNASTAVSMSWLAIGY